MEFRTRPFAWLVLTLAACDGTTGADVQSQDVEAAVPGSAPQATTSASDPSNSASVSNSAEPAPSNVIPEPPLVSAQQTASGVPTTPPDSTPPADTNAPSSSAPADELEIDAGHGPQQDDTSEHPGTDGQGGQGQSSDDTEGSDGAEISDPPPPSNQADAATEPDVPAGSYDELVLQDAPVAYWAVDQLGDTEPDLSGNGHVGEYRGSERDYLSLPNGDPVAVFNGEDNYFSVESSPEFSIPTTGNLTWEVWISPEILQFPNDSGGYVNWMGKCDSYSPTCEWEARMYNTENDQGRCNRISAYAFNPSAGLGSAADWQPECGLIEAGQWYHVVGQYTLHDQPEDCQNAEDYPGSIEIWVNGVKWDHSSHGQTGCMSQYDVVPQANDSTFTVGTMAHDTWFQGAIGKVAIYDTLLPEARIAQHYEVMTGRKVSGSCGDDCSF